MDGGLTAPDLCLHLERQRRLKGWFGEACTLRALVDVTIFAFIEIGRCAQDLTSTRGWLETEKVVRKLENSKHFRELAFPA